MENGTLVVMMATHRRYMYFLKGSTIVGGVTAISDMIGEVVESSNSVEQE